MKATCASIAILALYAGEAKSAPHSGWRKCVILPNNAMKCRVSDLNKSVVERYSAAHEWHGDLSKIHKFRASLTLECDEDSKARKANGGPVVGWWWSDEGMEKFARCYMTNNQAIRSRITEKESGSKEVPKESRQETAAAAGTAAGAAGPKEEKKNGGVRMEHQDADDDPDEATQLRMANKLLAQDFEHFTDASKLPGGEMAVPF